MRRYLKLILLLLLNVIVVYHLINYDNFPFSPNYQFPLNEIAIAYASGIFVIIFIEWNYQSLIKKNKSDPKRRVKEFLKIILLSCITLFIVIYAILIVRGNIKLYYLIISFLITAINLIIWTILVYGKSLVHIWPKLVGNDSLNIKSGIKIYNVDLSDLSHFSSKNKIVTAHLKSGKDIITNFNLKELEEILSNDFFRINRQYIINKEAIDVVKSAKNHTLKVYLKNQESKIALIVSRYRVPHFRKWFV